MAERDYDIGALGLHPRQIGTRRLDDVAGQKMPVEMLAIPDRDLRRHETDQPDADGMVGARPICQHPVENGIGRLQRGVVQRARAHTRDGIGAENRELRTAERIAQKIETVVELMVAKRSAVEAQRVHRPDDRMRPALRDAALIGDIIAHRTALQEVAIVEQHTVPRLCPRIGNQPGDTGQPDRIRRTVGVVVIGLNVDVQIGRAEDAQMHLSGVHEHIGPCRRIYLHDTGG